MEFEELLDELVEVLCFDKFFEISSLDCSKISNLGLNSFSGERLEIFLIYRKGERKFKLTTICFKLANKY